MCARYMVTMTIPFEKMHELGAVYVKIYKTFPSSIKIIAKSPFITTYEKEIHIYTLLEIDDNLSLTLPEPIPKSHALSFKIIKN